MRPQTSNEDTRRTGNPAQLVRARSKHRQPRFQRNTTIFINFPSGDMTLGSANSSPPHRLFPITNARYNKIRRGHGVQNPNTPTLAKRRHSIHGHTPPQNQAHRDRQPASAASSEARADGHKRSSNQTHPHAPNANTAGTRFTATPPQNQAHRDRQPASAASPEARADRHKRGRNTPDKYQTPTSIRH